MIASTTVSLPLTNDNLLQYFVKKIKLNCIFSQFFIGYQRDIPGIVRYEVIGTDNSGTFSLQITNVTVDDDADFECQVRKRFPDFLKFLFMNISFLADKRSRQGLKQECMFVSGRSV